jgi:hypothetical protein
MDHFEAAEVAFHERRFHEAERLYRIAVSQAPPPATHLHARLFQAALAIRPEKAWPEKEAWLRAVAAEQDWHALVETLSDPRRPFEHELRAEALHQLGRPAQASHSAAAHVEALIAIGAFAAARRHNETWRQRFPRAVRWRFHAVTLAAHFADGEALSAHVHELVAMLRAEGVRPEDAGTTPRAVLLQTLVELLEPYAVENGTTALLAQYVRLHLLLEAGSHFTQTDWKKLTELVIWRDGWRHLRLALESARAHGEVELERQIRGELRRRPNYSPVKFTAHHPGLRMRSSGIAPSEKAEALAPVLSDETVEWAPSLPFAEPTEETREDIEVGESVIRHLRLSPPPPSALPDLVMTYQVMNLGRVVDWLLAHGRGEELTPDTQRRLSYLAVMRAVEKREHHLALALLEEMLGSAELGLDEYHELKYAQGAVWLALGDHASARAAFDEVERLAPGYRRLRERPL